MATSTARDVLTDALRMMGTLSEYEDMNADQGSTALRALNLLMWGFNAEGIRYVHTDLADLDAVLNVPDGLVRSVVLMAVRDLGPRYGYVPSPDMAGMILTAKNALQANYFTTPLGVVDQAIAPRRIYDLTRLD